MGGDLYLNKNQLSSLPDSFGSIKVGGATDGHVLLHLGHNQLSSLPDSFGSITIGKPNASPGECVVDFTANAFPCEDDPCLIDFPYGTRWSTLAGFSL